MMKLAASLLLVLCLVGTAQVRAEEEDVVGTETEDVDVEEEHDEYEEDMDAHEVRTQFLFPVYGDDRLPVGKEVEVLVDFANDDQDVFNVTRVVAFLHSRFDYDYYVQNFTAKEVAGVTAPNSQISLGFKFTPDAKLETVEFILSGHVEYQMEGSDEPFQLMFMNSTVKLFDDTRGVDFATVSTYCMIVGALAAAVYFGQNFAASKGLVKKKKKFVPSKAKAEAVSTEWDLGEVYKPRSNAIKARRNKKPAKNAN